MGTVVVQLGLAVAGLAPVAFAGTTPAPLWAGADRLLLSCSADATATAALGADWCATVLAEARRAAPIPVVAAVGTAEHRSTLALHVAARDGEISLTIGRALQIDESEAAFFRRGPILPPGTAADPRVRAAFATALDGALPWRRASAAGPRSRRPTS